jgi:predicted RNA binding protein YcfA (HicA-like mRNA interferase family)
MPPFGPIDRRDLVYYLRRAGLSGPVSRGKHEAMYRGDRRVTVPNPHRGQISKELLARILRQAGIPREEWEKL